MDLHLFAVPGIPEVTGGADLGALIARAVARASRTVEAGDVFVVAQKVVSKAEGAIVRLDDVEASASAAEWAAAHAKDPRMIEVILRQSRRIVRMERGILITETHHGFICANAGVDASNVEPGFVTVLPDDPDASAARLRAALMAAFGCPVAVIVSDTFGRAWREGVVNVALGVAGLQPLIDYRGSADTLRPAAHLDRDRPGRRARRRRGDRHAENAAARRSPSCAARGSGPARATAARWCATRAAICSAERR